jgi:outer membrane receptor protein involved in Fe transport
MPLLGAGTAAHAQQDVGQGNAAPSNAPSSLEEITVTGSRIRRTTDFDTPNPTTVVDDSFLRNLGLVNVGDAVSQLPSNVSNDTPTTTGNANFFAGSTIANLRGLNPFFGSRTLTLVNNRRFVPTNQGDGVDLNLIPSVLIDRIDSVTGGASAAYGSGAISGVQNIFLNRTLEGARIDLDGYETGEGDGTDRHAGLAYGHGFLDDRAHMVVGYEYQKSDPIDCLDRDWCQRSTAFITGGTGMPANVLANNVRTNQMSYTGVFVNPIPGSATTLQADAAGTSAVPFQIGQGFPSVNPFTGRPDNTATSPFNNVTGGDGIPLYQYTNLRAPVDRDVFTGMFTYGLTDKTNMSIDVSYGKVETTNVTGALNDQGLALYGDNAYVRQTPALLAAYNQFVGPFGTASIDKDWTSQLDSHSTFTTKVKRAAIGFDGQWGDSSWSWEGYYQWGNTDREQLVADNKHLYAYLMATDAVLDASGNPVCRVTRDGFAAAAAHTPSYQFADPRIANGCVPLNVFGSGAIPQAAHDYAFGFLDENLDYTQKVWSFDSSGDIWKGLGAGPFQLAAGLEYRTEVGHNIGSQDGQPDWVRTDYLIQYGESFSGKVNVTESFLELNTPLLDGRPGAQRLEFNTAVRRSRYENTGLEGTTGETRTHDFTTWKISGLWDPVQWFRIRGSRSRDMRAANFRELYYGQIIHAGGAFGYCGPTGTFQRDPCTWSLQGNVNLKPETADTTTYGIVFTPQERLNGFQFAADYFDITIEDAIQQANVRRVLDGCQLSGIQEFCNLLVPDVPGNFQFAPGATSATDTGVEFLRALSFNGSGYSYKGIDFTGNYLVDLGADHSLNIRLLATKMLEQKFQPTPGQPFIDVVGQTGTSNSFLSDNQPTSEWVANLAATWNRGPIMLTGQVRYVDEGVLNYYGVTPDDPRYPAAPPFVNVSENRVPSYSVWTLSGSYTFDNVGPAENIQVFATINNLFDKDPPVAAGTGFGGGVGGTNPVFFDTLGRAYRVGVRMNF